MLKYVGEGAAFANVPARDLTEAELAEIEKRFGITKEFLINSGLYELTAEQPQQQNNGVQQ